MHEVIGFNTTMNRTLKIASSINKFSNTDSGFDGVRMFFRHDLNIAMY